MRRILGAAVIVLVAACGSDQTEPCGPFRCDVGLVCGDDSLGTCVLPDQLSACDGMPDGAACRTTLLPEGICRKGVCLEPSCGDGIISPGEDCEGTVDGVTCEDLGYYVGALRCGADCRYDTSACTQRCGDGAVNGPEECDGAALAGLDCTSFGFYDAPGLTCDAGCRADTSACTGFCGDGTVNGAEECDAPDGTDEGACPGTGRIVCTSCVLDFGGCS